MDMRRLFSRLRNIFFISVIAMAAVGGLTFAGLNYAVDRAVTVDAEQKAAGWASYFIEIMPGLEQLLQTGVLSQEQMQSVTAAERLGDVFRFKLFDPQGGVVLVSDEAAYDAEPASVREHSATAAAVLNTGRSSIQLKDGTGKANRPPLYVEAYVPVVGPDGGVQGVVEVYIDQTNSAALFKTTFATMAVGLAVAVSLAFGVPTVAFLLSSSQASEAKERVEFLAHYDTLTGLLNRASFGEQLEARLAGPIPDGEVLAVVFFDVDDFKAINDTHGHEAGDEFLKHVANAMTARCGANNLVARLGGDEFTVALAGRSQAGVMYLVDQIIQEVRSPVIIRGKTVLGRVSAGIYMIEASTGGIADAMHKADIALYQAKIDGRNTSRVFNPEMESRMQERRALEQLIRDAVTFEGFEIHYQPLLHASSKLCAGFEALLRLPGGQGGFVAPSTFIPVAESMGLINEIGTWVIEKATQAASTWPSHLFVSVNLSVKQFHDQKLVGHVRAALARAGLRPQQLELEVTESMLMDNTASIAHQLRALKDMGVSIAMDDFGTGYSSLGYLWQFEFDKIKIDRSFVSALGREDHQAHEILDTIIMLGHKLDMTVTAEGIETQSQADALNALACDHFQGYLYGHPAPENEIAGFLLSNVQERGGPAVEQRVTA